MLAAYSQNQNTYLVRAAARSTEPALLTDPLVRSTDPTPVFTWASRQLIVAGNGPTLLYVAWAGAAALFVAALLWATTDVRRSNATSLVWLTLLILVGSSGRGVLQGTWFEAPLEGVAGQYALGPVWQPSCAGVLLVLGTVAGARQGLRWMPSALLFLGALVHPTYLLAAVLLTFSLVVAHRRPTFRETMQVSAHGLTIAGLGAAVVALANRTSFVAITDPLATRGNQLLAYDRIPHHADVATWIGPHDLALATLVLIATVLARRRAEPATRALGTVLGVTLSSSAALTVMAAASGRASLLLGFPWRASVVLVPLSTALILALLADGLVGWVRRTRPGAVRPLTVIAVALLLIAAGSGLRDAGAALASPPAEGPVVTALDEARAEGVGLIPTGRTPIAMGQPSGDIRLNAGLPVYVDWKNNPNEPSEVVAWWERLQKADAAMSSPSALCDLVEHNDLTWAVLPPATSAAPCLRGWRKQLIDDVVVATAP